MRLINVDTFALHEFHTTDAAPPYAILSHTWGEDEVSFQDLLISREVAEQKAAFHKIRWTCEQAKEHGLDYAWVDTCCIDKSSSQELSEAINSMCRWYVNASVCYVYLADVPGHCPPLREDDIVTPLRLECIDAFEESRWFTRGWTLQELIAPKVVLFFGQAWNFIGALPDLLKRVSGITNIQTEVLDHSRPLSDLSIARRLSWASKRETTRLEDQAYALLGILDVNMPLLYGEGAKAFLRLQEEIIRQSTDQSIFAWDAPAGFIDSRELLLAPSPRCFINGSRIRRRRGTASESAFRISNKGLEITLPIVRRQLHDEPTQPRVILGILDCRYEGSSDVLALVLSQHPFTIHNTQTGTPALELYVSGFDRALTDGSQYARLLTVNPEDLDRAESTLLTVTRDLQSQAYFQAFNTNEASWFPIRFTGNQPKRTPNLRDVHPDECWYEGTKTMRLRPPRDPHGGITVDTNEGRSVLVAFGLSISSKGSSQLSPQSRRIYGLDFIDPACPIQPHLEFLLKNSHKAGGAKALPLNQSEHIVARLWRGALTVSVENVTEEPASPRLSNASAMSASPPSLPLLLKRFDRGRNFSQPSRRDSLFQDDSSDRSEHSKDDPSTRVRRISYCQHCQDVKARELAEYRQKKDDERRKYETMKAEQEKVQRQKNIKNGVKGAGVGLSIGGVLADFAEFDFL